MTKSVNDLKPRLADNFIFVQEDSTQEKENILPPVGQKVLVQCRSFRCLAYRDENGRWRRAFGTKELPEVLQIVR